MAERARCPICRAPAAPRTPRADATKNANKNAAKDGAKDAAFPFCSHRCQLVDLSHWLDGDYRMPADPAEAMFGDDRSADGAE